MVLRVGDPAFTYMGMPAVVTAKNEQRQELTIDADPEIVANSHRHGYLKGLSPETRQSFNDIMDEVKSLADSQEKISKLQEKIAEFENHESESKRQIAKYLKAELAHTMNSQNISPRYYQIPFNKVP